MPDLAWLAQHFGAAGIVLVEADEDTSSYAGGHTTGAALLHQPILSILSPPPAL